MYTTTSNKTNTMILVITTLVLTTFLTTSNEGDMLIQHVLPVAAATTTIKAPVVAIPSLNQINYNNNVAITLERNACFGICPIYSLKVFGNGTVVYNGERFVNITGQKISTIPHQKVRELLEEFYKINYFGLNDTYNKIVKTDQPTVNTSINITGVYKSVFDNYGSIAPQGLRLLENKIDEITNSSKWIEPYVHPAGEPIRS
ncbi:MAG TPA: DUF6438 domain-containing protein [Nitrososphaeraceae archaeon]|nr:DUF6438 domain-containing protein [Nitrososphaeraceae archaeon]